MASRTVRVVPDVSGIDSEFDYLVPENLEKSARIGSIVRVDLNGRRVRGWVVDEDSSTPEGVKLRPVQKVSSAGPDGSLIELASWASWRWAGKPSFFLQTASPARMVRGQLPDTELCASDGAANVIVRKVPPAKSAYSAVKRFIDDGPTLVLVPSHRSADSYVKRLRIDGVRVAHHPDDWALAANGGVSVVGTRAAVWVRMPSIAHVVVVDAHDEAFQSERSPTWSAVDIAIERARRAGATCTLLSPVPRVEDVHNYGVEELDRSVEREGWAAINVVDLRQTDPRTGIYSSNLVSVLRGDKRVICILNRKGRAQLLICVKCDEIARCERCDGSLHEEGEQFTCARCQVSQPVVCRNCGSSAFKHLRPGVARVREELESLALREVGEVDGDSAELPNTGIIVGTEAVLHRVSKADVVVFIDFDQELMAPRYRGSEQCLVLLARASRIVGGRSRNGLVVVQTRQPEHDVISAAIYGDTGRFYESELPKREMLGWPPFSAIARISGKQAPKYVEGIEGLDLLGPVDDAYLAKGPDHEALCNALARASRPGGAGLRIEVDPQRI